MSKKAAITGFGVVLFILLGITLFLYSAIRTVVVSGDSMLPTFKSGQRLLSCNAYWLVGGIHEKDVVVVKEEASNEYIIKRVYKLGGEVVDWKNVPEDWSLQQGEYRVPEGSIFVLGDNREVSEDSRKFGAVPMNKVIGKIIKR